MVDAEQGVPQDAKVTGKDKEYDPQAEFLKQQPDVARRLGRAQEISHMVAEAIGLDAANSEKVKTITRILLLAEGIQGQPGERSSSQAKDELLKGLKEEMVDLNTKRTELKRIMAKQAASEDLTPQEQQTLNDVDANKDGSVSEDELRAAMLEEVAKRLEKFGFSDVAHVYRRKHNLKIG